MSRDHWYDDVPADDIDPTDPAFVAYCDEQERLIAAERGYMDATAEAAAYREAERLWAAEELPVCDGEIPY